MKNYQANVLGLEAASIERLEAIFDGDRDEFLTQDEDLQEKSLLLWCNNIVTENLRAQERACKRATKIDPTWRVLVI
jgi:hypothetical protein